METLINLSASRYKLEPGEIVLGSVIAIYEHLLRRKRDDGSFSPVHFAQTLVDLDAAIRDHFDEPDKLAVPGAPRWLGSALGHESPVVERAAHLLVEIFADLESELTDDDWEELNEVLEAVQTQLSNPVPRPVAHPAPTAALAARSDQVRTLLPDTAELREPLGPDHGSVDIPTCDRDGTAYVLLSADLALMSSGKADVRVSFLDDLQRSARATKIGVASWRPAGKDFIEGVQNGAEAANVLLGALRSPIVRADNVPVLELRGVIPPYQVIGGSAALPTALEILRISLGLSHPPYAATGSMRIANGKWVIEPTPIDIAAGKLNAVRDNGAKQKLALVASRDLENEFLLLLGDDKSEVTLDAAARKIWGDEYQEKIQSLTAPGLERLGFRISREDPRLQSPNSDDALIVRSRQADRFLDDLESTVEPTAWIVGGPVRSGKTWMIWDVVDRLKSTRRWSAVVLRFQGGASIRDVSSELEATLEIAAGILDSNTRRVLVLEDVPFSDELAALDRRLCALARKYGSHVVLTRRSDATTEWHPTSCREVEPIHSPTTINAFVEALFEQYGRRLARVNPETLKEALDAVDKQVARDLWWITEVARTGRSFGAMRSYLFSDVTAPDEETLKGIAYAALHGFAYPRSLRPPLPIDIAQRFSVQATEPNALTIPQRVLALLVVNNVAEGARIDVINQAEAARFLTPVIEHYIDSSDGLSLLQVLSSIRRESKDVVRLIFGRRETRGRASVAGRLSEKHKAKFGDVGLAATPEIAAGLAMRTSELVDAEVTRALLGRMLANLLNDLESTTPITNCRTLRLCLDAIDAHHSIFATSAYDAEDEERDLSVSRLALQREELLRRLAGPNGRLARILNREANPKELLGLGDCIDRDGHRLLCEAFFDCHDVIVARIEKSRNRHENALRILDLYDRMQWRLPSDASVVSSAIEDARDFARSVADEEGDFETLAEFCDWARLKLRLDRNAFSDGLIDHYSDTFGDLISEAQLDEVVYNLGRLHDASRHTLTQLLHRTPDALSPQRLRLDKAPLGQVADLLFALPKWHRVAAQHLLSSDNDRTPNNLFAKKLAMRVRHTLDARSCGRIIKAAAEIEDLHRDAMHEGFAYRLASEVGIEFYLGRIEAEPRHSIVYHLIDGLARIDHRYLEQLAPAVVERIANAINSGAVHEGPVGLAVRLCEGPHTGPVFQKMLADSQRIDVDAVIAGMTNSIDVEAMGAFHRLASLLPEALRQYRERTPEGPLALPFYDQAYIKGRPIQSLRAANRVVDTFRRAGWDGNATRIRRAFKYDTLAPMLRNAKAEGIDAALDELRILDPKLAADFLRTDRAYEILDYKLDLSMRDPQDAARLATAISRIDPQYVSKLNSAKKFESPRFTYQARNQQNPRTFALVCNQLLAIGVINAAWVASAYDQFWLNMIDRIRSPGALTQLLLLAHRLDALTDDHLLAETLGRLQWEGICRRLALGGTVDISYSGALLDLALLGGDTDAGLDFSAVLAGVEGVEQKLSTERWFGFLHAIAQVNQAAALSLLPRFDAEARHRAARPMQLNDVSLWRSIGAYALLRQHLDAGRPLALGDQAPASILIPKDPVTILFGTEWLAPCAWRNALREEARQTIRESAKRDPLSVRELVADPMQEVLTGSASAEQSQAVDASIECAFRFDPFGDQDTKYLLQLMT